jgi:NADP-dependent 3-hydroxy acid dehydrogenase YdfG
MEGLVTQSLANRIAVVTGASSGIGCAIARQLAACGARVCLVGRKVETLLRVANETGHASSLAFCYQADLEREVDIRALVASLREDCGRVDVLVHSAGTISLGPVEGLPVEDLDRQFAVNLRAPYLLTQALLPQIKACRGQIAFINSSAGLNAKGSVAQYAATKHALKALADSLREEVNGDGVRVLSLYIGRTATKMQADVHRFEGREYRAELLIQPEDVAAILISALCLPRTAEVTDIHIRPMCKVA